MLFPVFLAILIFLFGSKVIYAAENTEKEADRVQEALFEEFDFSKLDQEMKTLFPDEKLSFREILMQLISENGGSTAGTVVQFIKETVFYQFGTNKKNTGVYDPDRSSCCPVQQFYKRLSEPAGIGSQLLYSLYAAYDPVTCNFSAYVAGYRTTAFLSDRIYEAVMSQLLSCSCICCRQFLGSGIL